jgi:hypothetical protein
MIGACGSYGGGECVHRLLVGKPEGRGHFGDPDVNGNIIFRWIFRKLERLVGTG